MGSKTRNPHRWANTEWNRTQHAIGSSNTTQPHVPAPKKGTRTARDRRAINDQRDSA